MKLMEKMVRHYPDMTKNDQRIYELIRHDSKAFSLKPIGEVAEILKISKTTLMRFAKSLGFEGYAEFKKVLQEQEVLDNSPARKVKRAIRMGDALDPQAILQQEMANINSTFNSLDETDLITLRDLIIQADTVHAMAWGVSNLLSDVLALRLKMMGRRCECIRRLNGTLLEETLHLNEGDLLLVFELAPYGIETLEAVKAFKQRGGIVVVVTDRPTCPLLKYADLSFLCGTDSQFFGNSMVAPLALINLITSLVIFHLKDQVIDKLEEQRSILNNKKYYL